MTDLASIPFGTPEYWRAVRSGPESKPAPEDHPRPEHTTADPWPESVPVPGPVAQLHRTAESAGWVVRVGYSRGRWPDQYGRAGALNEWCGFQALHPVTRSRVVGLYNMTGKTWKTLHLVTRYNVSVGVIVTDAVEFLQIKGVGHGHWLRPWLERRKAERARIARERKAAKESEGE
jgi:hypothetical protein